MSLDDVSNDGAGDIIIWNRIVDGHFIPFKFCIYTMSTTDRMGDIGSQHVFKKNLCTCNPFQKEINPMATIAELEEIGSTDAAKLQKAGVRGKTAC